MALGAKLGTGNEVVIKPPSRKLLSYFAYRSGGTRCDLHIKEGGYIRKGDPFVTIRLHMSAATDRSFWGRYGDVIRLSVLLKSSLPDEVTFASPVSGKVTSVGPKGKTGHYIDDKTCFPLLDSDEGFESITALIDPTDRPDESILEENKRSALSCARKHKSDLRRFAFVALLRIALLVAALYVLVRIVAVVAPVASNLYEVELLAAPVAVGAALGWVFVFITAFVVPVFSLIEFVWCMRKAGVLESLISEVETLESAPDARQPIDESHRRSFQTTTPAGKKAPPPVAENYRRESTRSQQAETPRPRPKTAAAEGIERFRRLFAEHFDPQSGKYNDDVVRASLARWFERDFAPAQADKSYRSILIAWRRDVYSDKSHDLPLTRKDADAVFIYFDPIIKAELATLS